MYKLRKMILAFFLLCTMSLGFLGQSVSVIQGADTTSNVQTLGKIKMNVYDIVGGAPVAGVEFAVIDEGGKVIATPVTSPTGEASMDVPSGTYKVKQTKVPTGYILNSGVQTLTIWRTGTAIATFYNQKTSTNPTVTTAQLKVNAYDINGGAPIGGVEFVVTDTAGKVVATLITNPSGEATVNLSAGSYQVKQSKTPAGYALSGSVQSITLWQNSIATTTFYNQKTQPEIGQLKVKVYDINGGATLAGAEFTVTDLAGKVVTAFITNQNGEAMANLPSGNYRVQQTKAPVGYEVNGAVQSITLWRSSTTTVTIYNQKAQPDVGQFRVRLYDMESGAPLLGSEFSIVDVSGKVIQTITTNEQGEAITELATGSYQVKQTKASTGYSLNTAIQSFTAARGGIVTATFYNQKALPETGQIKVKVYDINGGVALSGVEVTITDDVAGKVVATAVTNQNGEALVTLPAGSYSIQETKVPTGYELNRSIQSFLVFRSGTITATFYNQKALPETGQLRVATYDISSGVVLKGAEFIVLDSEGKVVTTLTTGDNGSIIVNLAPGTYQLKETKAPQGYEATIGTQSFTVWRGLTTTATIYNQKVQLNIGQLKLHVYDVDGVTSLAGAEFLIMDTTGKIVGTLVTSESGEASTNLPVGSYQVKEVKAPQGYDLNTMIESVTIWQNGTTSIAFYNQKTKPASGTVKIKLYDITNSVQLAGAEFAVLDTAGRVITTVVTNQFGEAIANIPVGNYRVKENKAPSGYELNVATQPITVVQNGTTTVTFYNQKAQSKQGQLKINVYDIATEAALADVSIAVIDSAGKIVTTLTTNQLGEATVNLPAGSYQLKETKVPAGYNVNSSVQSITVLPGGIAGAIFYNQKAQSKTGQMKVRLYDMVGGSPLAGAEFSVLDISGKLLATLVTNDIGEAVTTLPAGNYQVKETKAPNGYNVSISVRSLTVWQNGSTTVTFYNQKIQQNEGNLVITKYDANGTNIIAGANFEVVDSTGKVILTPMTNQKGEATVTLAVGTYKVRDVKAVAAGLGENTEIDIVIEKGATHQVSFYNSIV